MKKKLFIITILSALLLLFTGCKSEPETLRVCLDIANFESMPFVESKEVLARGFVNYVAEYAAASEDGGPIEIEVEIIPDAEGQAKKAERDAMLTRIRTEIMSGEGPDVFIVACSGKNSARNGDPLFPNAEKAMEAGLFLPLDEYIENAQFMEWDKLMPEIMAAGSNEYGQQILPIAYALPITFYRESEVQHTSSKDITWEDMLEDETNILTAATAYSDGILDNEFHKLDAPFENAYLECILGGVADYSEDKLLFTEEELLQRTMELIALIDREKAGEFESIPTHYKNLMQPEFNRKTPARAVFSEDVFEGISEKENLTMVPLYSDDGGVTATITCYAAINVNTKQPEKAFYVLDHLLSKEMQRATGIYTYACYGAMPVHQDVMRQAFPTRHSIPNWYMSTQNFEEYNEVREQITNVHFRSELDIELSKMFEECYTARKNPEKVADIVHESYHEMKRLLAE